MLEYFAATVGNIALWREMNLRVRLDDKYVEGHCLIAVASNIRHYVGGSVKISRQAYLDDGLMELWLLSGSTLADVFRYFFDMQSRRHLTSDQARCIPFRKTSSESTMLISLQMDGEPMPGAQKASLEVLQGSVQVHVPPQAGYLLGSEKV
jgi:diacylglycerol kinase family enzyme